MAYVFYAAIFRALNDRKVKEAAPLDDTPQDCNKEYGNGILAGEHAFSSDMHSRAPVV